MQSCPDFCHKGWILPALQLHVNGISWCCFTAGFFGSAFFGGLSVIYSCVTDYLPKFSSLKLQWTCMSLQFLEVRNPQTVCPHGSSLWLWTFAVARNFQVVNLKDLEHRKEEKGSWCTGKTTHKEKENWYRWKIFIILCV